MIPASRGVRERIEFGRGQRRKLRRSDHAHWDAKRRKHDPIEIILAVNRERIPALVPVKMARMALSPFGFFRGNVPVMAADLAAMRSTEITVQICGDAHVRNLGAYAGPDGRLIFDINDFDETIRAPWEWDLKRLGASLVLAGREAQNSDRLCRDAVLACAEIYRRKMTEFSGMRYLEVAKYRIHRLFAGRPGTSVLQRAERATPDHSLAKLTVARGKSRVFREVKPILTHPPKPRARQVLHTGNQDTSERVVRAQRMLQVQSDILLGWTSLGGADYLVRQLNDHKASIEDEDLKGQGLVEYATTCGEVLAKSHARSGDPAVLAGYLGTSDRCDKALAEFSVSYANQTTEDYEAFKKAIRSGRINAGKAYL